MPEQWNAKDWLNQFVEAQCTRSGFHDLRRRVWKSTIDIIEAREYSTQAHRVALDERGEYEKTWRGTTWYDDAEALDGWESRPERSPSIEVCNQDCLLAADSLVRGGYNVAVLNMANRRNPGGGVSGGAGAQEENIFRRTTVLRSLFRFAEYGEEYGVPSDPEGHAYPLFPRAGAIHSDTITVVRGSEAEGYPLLDAPWEVALLTMPAIPGPALEWLDDEPRLREDMEEATRIKIRGLLQMAARHGHDALVLGAWGCGAFRQPPGHVAEIFAAELDGAPFRKVSFAIIDDHNAGALHNPKGNFAPFCEVFGT